MRKLIGVVGMLGLVVGCGGKVSYSQVPPSKADIVWTWVAPAECTASAPCSYYISVLVIANGTTSCPASTGASYTPLNAGAPISALTVTDTGEGLGTTVCAIAQTLQNGLVSQWSAPSSPVVMPVAAPAPAAPSGTEKTAAITVPTVGGSADRQREMALGGVGK